MEGDGQTHHKDILGTSIIQSQVTEDHSQGNNNLHTATSDDLTSDTDSVMSGPHDESAVPRNPGSSSQQTRGDPQQEAAVESLHTQIKTEDSPQNLQTGHLKEDSEFLPESMTVPEQTTSGMATAVSESEEYSKDLLPIRIAPMDYMTALDDCINSLNETRSGTENGKRKKGTLCKKRARKKHRSSPDVAPRPRRSCRVHTGSRSSLEPTKEIPRTKSPQLQHKSKSRLKVVLKKDKFSKKQEHDTVKDTKNNSHVCTVCNKEFSMFNKLRSHLKSHTAERQYLCAICGRGFHRACHLTSHQTTHTGEKPYPCTVCGKAFSQSSTLRVHKRSHSGEKPFKCDECDKAFSVVSSLKAHKHMHSGLMPYTCTLCGIGYTSSYALVKHRRMHSGEKPFRCTVCGKGFIQPYSLIVHQRVHTGERPYTCAVCGASFARQTSYREHQRIHTGERPFLCAVCGKCFTSTSHLNKHQRVHTGQKKPKREKHLQCTVCNQKFADNGSLSVHQRLHTGERPYGCSMCVKRFNSNFNLKIHERTHTGEKPYVCKICGRGFAQSSNLDKHKRVHTGEELDSYNCPPVEGKPNPSSLHK